jgi:hypothetical protein
MLNATVKAIYTLFTVIVLVFISRMCVIITCSKCFIIAAGSKNNLPHLTEGPEPSRLMRDISTNKTAMPKVSNVLLEVRDWWHEQLGYNTQSSDEDNF